MIPRILRKIFGRKTTEAPEGLGVPDVALPEGFALVHATEKLSAWRQASSDPTNDLFAFNPPNVVSLVGMPLWQELQENLDLVQYQRLVIDERWDEIVGYAYCVPFFCPGLAMVLDCAATDAPLRPVDLVRRWAVFGLPDGGLGTMLFRGVRQAFARSGKAAMAKHAPWTEDQTQELATGIATLSQTPNALCGIHVAVKPGFHHQGIAEVLLDSFKSIARERDLATVVFPVSLTNRSLFDTSFREYFHWSKDNPYRSNLSWLVDDTPHQRMDRNGKPVMPFDPWLRTHLERGGNLVKVASHSMQTSLPVDKWMPFMKKAYKYSQPNDAAYPWQADGDVDGSKLDGISPAPGLPEPLKWNQDKKLLEYKDKDVWILHGV
ncbi:Acyl-CoA N-acyltransferase [Cordyceps fumosorosea ARSEF 2679]|uniref:Acyl-CoA N-acyltransferase n=1 Tax=Cordyceps fumosorosea (strain ARSEF 2679) TaxID=1081104 RepID=A0A167M3F5_CORFA|nr:Acyl-CoA N-acyltransferase [Cordyceps fumosorosea ARSEF 2679]OAA53871.1 Acyl-CoA N-acyltransferase [Cordyceps fumosorosea ARSEF 2679]